MRQSFLPFSVPVMQDDDIAGVVEVLKSGWITTGPKCAAFEKAFAEYVGCKHACVLTSATAGLHTVLMALKLPPGSEVITSSMTWVSTVNLLEMAGLCPVFADVDPGTLMLTPESVAAKITPRTRMLLPVHYAGAPVDLDPLRELARKHNLLFIEDAAHAAGTAYKGVRIGKSGTSIFSFHPIKNMTTGEGGMVCSDDDDLIAKVRRYRFHGLAKDAWDRYSKRGNAVMEVVEPGLKYNLTDMQASLGLTQLKKLDDFNARRTVLAQRYNRLFQEIPEIRVLQAPAYSHTHTHHLYVIMVATDRIKRDDFVAGLKERNIGTGIHFKAAHTHQYYQQTGRYPLGSLPHTEWASDRLCSIPLFPGLAEADQLDVVATVKEVLATGGAA